MKPAPQFLGQSKRFWASVRAISERMGYTRRGTQEVLVPTTAELARAVSVLGLTGNQIVDAHGDPTNAGKKIISYFAHRAQMLNEFVEPRLMNAAQAKKLFTQTRKALKPQCPLPMNKQKGKKRAPAYLTGLVNMLVEANCAGFPCDYDPRQLTCFTRDGQLLRTLARRVDGAFPTVVNPAAVWEIKEYYHTTTFGSRVADGIYETLLDGLELQELRSSEGVSVGHYLIVDAHYTWWECGRSYLCRIIDMLHMGLVDEVLFGREVMERLPTLVREWTQALAARKQ